MYLYIYITRMARRYREKPVSNIHYTGRTNARTKTKLVLIRFSSRNSPGVYRSDFVHNADLPTIVCIAKTLRTGHAMIRQDERKLRQTSIPIDNHVVILKPKFYVWSKNLLVSDTSMETSVRWKLFDVWCWQKYQFFTINKRLTFQNGFWTNFWQIGTETIIQASF